jgi:hypothetical protein
MTLSPKYQDELRWGIGYIPVFFSCFGIATMLLAGMRLVRGRPALALVVAVLLGAGGAVSFAANRQVVERINRDLRYPRELVEDSMRRGLAPCLPEGSTLIVAGNQPWLTPATASSFFRQHARTHLEVRMPGQFLDRPGAIVNANRLMVREVTEQDRVYYLDLRGHSANEGHVVLARLERLTTTDDEVLGAAARRLFLYVRLPRGRSDFWLAGEWLDCESGEHTGRFVINRQQTISVGGIGWALCQVDSPPGFLFDLNTLDVRTDPMQLPGAVPSGFKDERDLLLGERSDALVHVGLRGGTVGGLPLPPATLGESFTIEALLRPFGQQPAMATILGNIPGRSDHQGFTLRHPGVASSDRYELIYGDGENWHRVGEFALSAGRWTHLAVVFDGRSVAIHVNGEEVFRNDSLPTPYHESDTPLCLGNALGRDQPFHGIVEEVRIVGRVMGKDEITSNAERILRGRR